MIVPLTPERKPLLVILHLGGWRNSGRAGRVTEMTGETEASEPAAASGGET